MAGSRPTNAEARAFHNRFDSYGDALKPAGYGGPSRPAYDAGGIYNDPTFKAEHPRYPDYHYPDDKAEDTRIQTMLAGRDFYGATPQFVIGDREMDYLMKKKEARALLDFKQFVEDSIPRGTPWAKEYFEKIMPGWYQSKIDIINNKLDIVQKFIEITIRGPQSIDDMFLLYQIYQGNITIPANFQDLVTGGASQTVATNRFHSGLFNPKRFLDKKIMLSRHNQQNLANFSIPGIDPKTLGGAVDAPEYNADVYSNVRYLTGAPIGPTVASQLYNPEAGAGADNDLLATDIHRGYLSGRGSLGMFAAGQNNAGNVVRGSDIASRKGGGTPATHPERTGPSIGQQIALHDRF